MEAIHMRYFACVFVFILASMSMMTVEAINIRQAPTSKQVRPGATVTFTCDVDQKMGTTLYWTRLDTREYISHDRNIYTRLPPDRRRRYSIEGDRLTDVFTLRISNVQLVDDGTYQCGYADGLGRLNVLGAARLTVLIEPSVESPMCYIDTVSGDRNMRKPGDIVDMVCTTEGGNPIPDLTWFRGEEELEENEGRRVAVHRQVLRHQDATLNYTCVMRGPLITTRRACVLRPMEIPPVLRIDPLVNTVTVGSTATFSCSMSTMRGGSVGVRSYTWNVDADAAERLRESSPGKMTLKQNRRVLEISDVRPDDHNTSVTCQAQTMTGEVFTGMARLVIFVQPTVMTTDALEMTTVDIDNGGVMSTDGAPWHRAMRPTHGIDYTGNPYDDNETDNDDAVTVGMKPKIPAFLTGRTFIMTSAVVGAVVIVIIIVTVVVVIFVRQRRNEKRIPITTPVLVMEHGPNDPYATVIEMKRKTGSTYHHAATLPGLKADRSKLAGLPEVMRGGGSSLSFAARNASLGLKDAGDDNERSPLYAKPDKTRTSKSNLFGGGSGSDSKKNSLVDNAEGNAEEYPRKGNGDGQEGNRSASSTLSNKDLNAEGLIYADLVLEGKEKSNNIASKKGTQYASIVPSGKP